MRVSWQLFFVTPNFSLVPNLPSESDKLHHPGVLLKSAVIDLPLSKDWLGTRLYLTWYTVTIVDSRLSRSLDFPCHQNNDIHGFVTVNCLLWYYLTYPDHSLIQVDISSSG